MTVTIVFGLHQYKWVAELVGNSLQSGWFRVRSTASVNDSLCVWGHSALFFQDNWGHPSHSDLVAY